MKILTKEEEDRHYRLRSAVLRGGIGGLIGGTVVGVAGVIVASRRYPGFRALSIPFRAFVVTSTASFSGILTADRYSRGFEKRQRPDLEYTDAKRSQEAQLYAQKTQSERIKDWATTNKYGIVGGSWVLSICTAFAIVSRNRYLSGAQKLVQARVYAQGLTLAVVIASLALEAREYTQAGNEQRPEVLKNVRPERYRGENQWIDMVEASERRMQEREELLAQHKV
ncbi:hypothetical protein MBLNU459_g1653t1 [Dothideomycetes sp. NU459]